jgi:hypothetical protein
MSRLTFGVSDVQCTPLQHNYKRHDTSCVPLIAHHAFILSMPPKKHPCGNPLFLSWIEGAPPSLTSHIPANIPPELRDQAREKGTKAYEVYSKAARSLNACPVTYDRPRDLVCLVGIGPKTVSILEGKWKKHCEENGLPPPGTPPSQLLCS